MRTNQEHKFDVHNAIGFSPLASDSRTPQKAATGGADLSVTR
jgi:hypothetical protein